ncbi:MAG: Cysteine desulfurase IscS [Chlamydiae bacterium]|nr:Cysteine desulfurase IscS [Chlamydiota bacterium]
MEHIYLDNNATTLIDSRVKAVLLEVLEMGPLNASSVHFYGQMAKTRLIEARRHIAQMLDVHPQEIIFTSGATEALNGILLGFRAKTILTSTIEHSAVHKTCQYLETLGVDVIYLKPTSEGNIDPKEVEKALEKGVDLAVFGAANSETGVLNDIESIAKLCQEHSTFCFVDGAQLMGKEKVIIYPGCDAICFSAHKFHGPCGVGFCYLNRKAKLKPFLIGGGQEYARRSGTQSLPLICALEKAVDIAQSEIEKNKKQMQNLRDQLEDSLLSNPCIQRNGSKLRLCNTTNLFFDHVDGEGLLFNLDMEGVCASLGSACSSGALEPSRVLLEMGYNQARALSSLRFSLSRFTTEEEIKKSVGVIQSHISKISSVS